MKIVREELNEIKRQTEKSGLEPIGIGKVWQDRFKNKIIKYIKGLPENENFNMISYKNLIKDNDINTISIEYDETDEYWGIKTNLNKINDYLQVDLKPAYLRLNKNTEKITQFFYPDSTLNKEFKNAQEYHTYVINDYGDWWENLYTETEDYMEINQITLPIK